MKLSTRSVALALWYASLFSGLVFELALSQSTESSSSTGAAHISTTSMSSPPIILTSQGLTPTSTSQVVPSLPSSTSTTSTSLTTQVTPSQGLFVSPTLTVIYSNATNVTTACSNLTVAQKCINSFKNLYAFSPNDTDADANLINQLPCFNYTSKPTDGCASEIPQNCSILSQALADNRTSFGLLCTSWGELKHFEWASLSCQNMSSSLTRAINDVTTAFCTSAINSSLVCNRTSSGVEFIDKKILLNAILKKNACPGPTTTAIPLLPNPVGPAAMTAIVVLVVMGIICILAGFFFWPKCHLSEDQIRLGEKKKRIKKKKVPTATLR